MSKPIFCIKGERNTGTKFLRKLLNYYFDTDYHNLYGTCYDADGYYGWKHGFIFDNEVEQLNRDQAIVIVINKSIYSWLISMYSHSYELKSIGVKPKSYNKYISPDHAVVDRYDNSWIGYFYGKTGAYATYKNLYDLRYRKYRSMLNNDIEKKIYVKYEDLLDDHYSFIQKLAQKFNLEITKPHNKSFDHYSRRGYYLNKEYLKLYDRETKRIIGQNVDTEAEKEMGYLIS